VHGLWIASAKGLAKTKHRYKKNRLGSNRGDFRKENISEDYTSRRENISRRENLVIPDPLAFLWNKVRKLVIFQAMK
jgi:hypothetical protein